MFIPFKMGPPQLNNHGVYENPGSTLLQKSPNDCGFFPGARLGTAAMAVFASTYRSRLSTSAVHIFQQLKKTSRKLRTFYWMIHIVDAFGQFFLGFLGFSLFWLKKKRAFFFCGARKKAAHSNLLPCVQPIIGGLRCPQFFVGTRSVSCSISAAESFRIGSIEPTLPVTGIPWGYPRPTNSGKWRFIGGSS